MATPTVNTVRQLHRWLGIVAAIQLLAWTGSGLYFSLIPIEQIRGEGIVRPESSYRLGHVRLVSPNAIIRARADLADVHVDQVQINQRLDNVIYVIKVEDQYLAFNAETGAEMQPLTEAQAIAVATSAVSMPITGINQITTVPPGGEYRGGELPAFQVSLKDGTELYIGASTGQLRAVRTSEWRLYDLLWSLHIMDYEGRDNFNHLLLQIAALLGIVTVLSGIVLFVTTARPLLQQRHR